MYFESNNKSLVLLTCFILLIFNSDILLKHFLGSKASP